MKRTFAMLLAALLLFAALTVGFAASAEEDRIVPHDQVLGVCDFCQKQHTSFDPETGTLSGLYSCTCCLQCDYLDGTALTKCARNSEGHYRGSLCCESCTGFFPCLCTETDELCDCVYCGRQAQVNEVEPVELVPQKATDIFTRVVTTVTSKLSDVFGKLFEVLFAIFGV